MRSSNNSLIFGLSYHTTGPRSETVLLAFHGAPGSSLDFVPDESLLKQHQIQLLTFDRPGYGDSNPLPGYSLLKLAIRVVKLLDHLNINHCEVLGFSGGVPHAMALASLISDRITKMHLVAGLAPIQENTYSLLPEATQNLLSLALANRDQTVTQLNKMASDGAALLAIFQSIGSECDQALLNSEPFKTQYLKALSLAWKQGAVGLSDDLHSIAIDWGFSITDIHTPTRIWQGDRDINIPLRLSQTLQQQLPNAKIKILQGEGHFWLPTHWFDFFENCLNDG